MKSAAANTLHPQIALWFTKDELVQWKSHSYDWIYEK